MCARQYGFDENLLYLCRVMEIIIVLVEYFKIKKWKYLKGLIIPFLIGITVYFFTPEKIHVEYFKDFYNSLISVLGIMIGFTISVFSVLIAMDNKNIREAKIYTIDVKMYNKRVSLYDSLLINYIYIIIIQIMLLLANLFVPFFCNISLILVSVDIAFLFHIFLAIIRNVVDFYFILTKKN